MAKKQQLIFYLDGILHRLKNKNNYACTHIKLIIFKNNETAIKKKYF